MRRVRFKHSILQVEHPMKALSKFLFVVSLVSFSALAQAEGVSHEDIERGNNPFAETLVIKSES
jgi:hypothetical protein